MSKSERSTDEPISSVEFREPPPRIRYDWATIAGQLRQRPGEWAVVFERDRSSIVVAIRMGHIVAMRSSAGIEVRTTNNVRQDDGPRLCTLYARYVADNDTTKGSN